MTKNPDELEARCIEVVAELLDVHDEYDDPEEVGNALWSIITSLSPEEAFGVIVLAVYHLHRLMRDDNEPDGSS